jgi:hypothetical protein
MLIGSNKEITNSNIFEDIHIYDAKKVTIVGCMISGDVIVHESCQYLLFSHNIISGSLVMPDSNHVVVEGCAFGRAIPMSQELKIFKDSQELIKEAKRMELEKVRGKIDRNDDLIIEDE